MNPKKTYWYRNYIKFPKLDDKQFKSMFRNRFRLPYKSYQTLLEIVERSEYFSRWNNLNEPTNKIPKTPISLLLLGALRYLGRGWTFDDLTEATGVSIYVHRNFFMYL